MVVAERNTGEVAIGADSSNNASGGNPSGGAGGNFGQGAPNIFGAKQDDPLIKAETEKKVNEQKGALEVQFRQSIEEIDKHFELRKKELMVQN